MRLVVKFVVKAAAEIKISTVIYWYCLFTCRQKGVLNTGFVMNKWCPI